MTASTASPAANGSIHALARWFDIPLDASGPHDDHVRETVLAEVYRFTAWGRQGGTIILKTPGGRCVVEAKDVRGCRVVVFDYVPSREWRRFRFWMNASSVADLGDALRAAADREANFTDLFIND